MKSKMLEVRDRATFIPVLAVQLDPDNDRARYLLARAGFGVEPSAQAEYVQLVYLSAGTSQYDPYEWGGSRTLTTAHDYIIKHWDELESGAVVDVEFILGETSEPKRSESGVP